MKNLFKPFILGLILVSMLGAAAFSAVSHPIRSAINADNSRMYVPSTTSIASINIFNPASPVSTGNLSFGFASPTIYDLQAYQFSSNNYLFVSTYDGMNGKIYVFDTNSDPGTKVATISLPASVSPRGLAVTSSSITISGPSGSTTTYTGHLFVAATNGNVYRYAVSAALFSDASQYTLSATYETGSSGLFGLAVKRQTSGRVPTIAANYDIYTSSLDHGQIFRISSTDESVVTIDSSATGATYLSFSTDNNLLFARVLQSDKDVRVFDLAVEPNAEIPGMAVGLGGSTSECSSSIYEGNYYAGNGLYFSKYDSTAVLEKLYKYEPSSTPATTGWSRTRAITSWTPGATDYLVGASNEAGWAVWRTNSEYGSYSLVLVDTGTEEITTPTTETATIEVIDDFEGSIVTDAHYSTYVPPISSATLAVTRASGTSYDTTYAMKVQYSSSPLGVGSLTNLPYWSGTYESGSTIDLTNSRTIRFHYKGDGSNNKFYLVLIEESGSDGVEELFCAPTTYNLNSIKWTTAEVAVADLTLTSNSPSGGNGSFDKKIIGYRIAYTGNSSSFQYHYFDNIQGVSDESAPISTSEAVISGVSIVRDGDAVGSSVTISWTSTPAGSVDIYTKTGTFSAVASEWTLEFNDVSASTSQIDSSNTVGNGIHKFYKVVPDTRTTLADSDLTSEVVGKFDLAVGDYTAEPDKFFISIPLNLTSTTLSSAFGSQPSEGDCLIVFNIDKNIPYASTYTSGSWSTFPSATLITDVNLGYAYGYMTTTAKFISVVGDVFSSSNSRTITGAGGGSMVADWVGNAYPLPVGVASTGLDSSTAGTDMFSAGSVYYFNANADLLDIAVHTSSGWVNGDYTTTSTMEIQPGIGYMFTEPNSSFTWTQPKAY
ncbi:MAG: carbohydrate binding domain-containing protein [Candidatus Margulisiibacteriota bacterium]